MGRLPQILTGGLFVIAFSAASFGQIRRAAQAEQLQSNASMEIRAQWGCEPGVTRFRFQLARDRQFNDIVVDRVVSGTETRVLNLEAGRYFWRVARMTRTPGRFSRPRAVEAFKATEDPSAIDLRAVQSSPNIWQRDR